VNDIGAPDLPARAAGLLAGRRGVVLGVSSENSVGYQVAKDLRALGAEVAVTSRRADADRARLARALGCDLDLAVDAGDDASFDRAFSVLGEAWGRLDFLVHTMAHVPDGVLTRPLLELGRDDFHAVLDAGARSLIVACKHAARLLESSDSPRVVALTSASDLRMTPSYHAMGICKAALRSAVLYLAYELGPRAILCNAVSFSLLATDGACRAVGEQAALATARHVAKRAPTKKPLEVEHVTGAIAFLVSPLCQNLTGEVLTVDGGFSRTYHDPAAPGLPSGPACATFLVRAYVEAFPDVVIAIDQMVAEGELVATRWTLKGTHRGPLRGLQPTGKTAIVSGLVVARFDNGKIAEAWSHWDSAGLMKQLGVG
jgi:enoyl-[acyl-carrier protein] reductase I